MKCKKKYKLTIKKSKPKIDHDKNGNVVGMWGVNFAVTEIHCPKCPERKECIWNPKNKKKNFPLNS